MAKDPRYNLIRPKYKRNEIRLFSDIFLTLPKSLVAKDLGKEKRRFNELVDNPNEFTWLELEKFSSNCEMNIVRILHADRNESIPMTNQRNFDTRMSEMMFEERKLKRLEDIFDYVTRVNRRRGPPEKARYPQSADGKCRSFFFPGYSLTGRIMRSYAARNARTDQLIIRVHYLSYWRSRLHRPHRAPRPEAAFS